MIFKTINTDAKKLTEQFGLLNKSFLDIKKDFANGLGFKNSLFQTSISKTDYQSLQKFNSAIKATNDGLTKSQRITKAWNENMTDCSMAAKRMGNDIITGKKNIQDVSNSMKTATVSTKALGVAMNVFANVGFMLAITAITKVVTELAQAQENAVQTAKEATEAYKDEISSIADYKQRLSELHKELNSGNLSYEETKTKRTELMSIQDELIKKFGTEKGAIASVTEAVNGQVDALDNLTEKAYRDWVAKADEQTFWNKLLPGGKSGLDQAIDYMETDQTVSFYDMQNANLSDELQEIQKEIDKTIQSKYNLEKSFATFNVTGRPDEIKEQLDNIIQDYMDLSKDVFTEKGIDSSLWDDYRKEVVDSINEAKNEVDKGLKDHQETYKTYIEGLIKYDSEYSDEYANILQKRAELESAQNSGNKEEIQKARQAFMDAINKGIEESSSNENIRKYFESLYPELQSEFSDWAFEFDLKANVKGLNDVANEIGEKYSATDLLDMINTEGTQEGEESFNKLIDKAIEYGVCTDKSAEEVQKLIDLLVELGIVQDNVQGSTSSDKTAISLPKTFKEAWDSIGTEGVDKEKKAAQEAKDELLKLAEAGKLTVKAFENSSIAEQFLKDTGLSAEEATKKVNKLVSSIDQLSSMKSGISSISSILGEKKENLSNKKTKNNGIGADILASMPDDVKAQTDEYERFVEVMGNGKSSMEQCQKAANALATAYVNSSNFLSNLTTKNKDYYISVLEEMNVENASEVVKNALTKQTYALRLAKLVNANASKKEIAALQEEAAQYGITSTALANYVLQEKIANNNALDTSKSIKSLIRLAEQCGATSKVIVTLRDLLRETSTLEDIKSTKLSDYTASIQTDAQHAVDEAFNAKGEAVDKQQNKIDKLNKKLQKMLKKGATALKVDVAPTPSTSGKTKDKSSKDKTKTKQVIDWIERRLKNLQNTIDYTSSKLQNLFSVKAKNNNLDKQIKTTTKLINEYGIAAEKYQQKANQVAKASTKTVKGKKGKKKKVAIQGLSKDVISKIKTGKLTKKTKLSSLIKEYGEDAANKIQSYIDYYDKAQDAKKNKQDQIAKRRELQIQKNQNYVDDYNAKATLAETKAGNAVGYKKQNSYIATQLSYLNKSYQKQIAIAKLNKDTTEQARLQAEYEAKKVELQKQQIENLKTEYDNRIGLIDNDEQNVNNTLSQMEARGQIIQSSYYSSINKYENQKLSKLNSELKDLKAQQNTFTKYSQDWYDLQSDIQSVKNAINDAKVAIIENNKKVGELRQAMYDDIAERNSNISTEANFLAGLLGDNLTDDKTGGLTKEGLAMLGTYGIDMEANSNTAKNRKAEREELEKLIASYKKGDSHALDAYGSLEAAEKKLSEIIQKQQEAISAEYANEKQIYDLMTQRYEAKLSYIQSIIEARKKELDLEKDLYSYQRNIANQTKNIATLEKQLASLQGDTSEEGRAKLQKIQVSLDEANQELQDTEYERYISDQQDMLDNMYSQYEDLLQELEKDFEKVVQDGVKTINDTSKEISTTLSTYSSKYGYNPSKDMKSILKGLNVATLPDSLSEGLSELGLIFKNSAQDIIDAYTGKTKPTTESKPKTNTGDTNNAQSPESNYIARRDSQTIASQTSSASGSSMTIAGMQAAANYNSERDKLKKLVVDKNYSAKAKKSYDKYESKLNQLLAKHTGYVIKSGDNYIQAFAMALGLKTATKGSNGSKFAQDGNVYETLKKKFSSLGFQTGGIVRSNAPKTGDNVWVRVNPDETILTKKFTDILPYSLNVMNDFTKSVTLPNYSNIKTVSPNVGNTFGDIVINAELPNVKDSYDFVQDIQNNRKTQRAIEVSIKDCMSRGKITNNIQSIR